MRAIAEETVDVPLHYKLPLLLKSLKMVPMPLRTFRGTLKALGYSVSHFHREPEAIKTDAPNAVVYDLLRLWASLLTQLGQRNVSTRATRKTVVCPTGVSDDRKSSNNVHDFAGGDSRRVRFVSAM